MSQSQDPFRGPFSRRAFLQRSAAAAALASPLAALIGACGPTSGSPAPTHGATSAKNPFGVDESAPLNAVIFKGGFGDDYAKFDLDLYKKKFPKATTTETAIQQISQTLQPQFVAGTPPDVIDDSGAYNIALGSLVSQNQVADLSDVYNAPTIDDANVKVKDTIIAGTQDPGLFNGKQYGMVYALSLYSIWYSKSLFDKKGWQFPKTWDDMLKLCAQIQKAGEMSPWTYQGKYPQYMTFLLQSMIQKLGGTDVVKKIDNLESGAWLQPEVKEAATMLYQLADKGYIMPGSAGLTHTQSQAAWAGGKAAFIPCGSWLPNELGDITPKGFDMVIAAVPNLTAKDKLPAFSINASGTETFIVPAQAKNSAGGKEFLRIMLSKEASRKFTELTQTLTVVKDAAKGMNFGTAVQSSEDLLAKGAPHIPTALFSTWYQQLFDEDKNAMGDLLTKGSTPQQYVDRMQKKADEVAKDPNIKKFHR